MNYQQITCQITGKTMKADKMYKIRNNEKCIENVVSVCHNCPFSDCNNPNCKQCYGTIAQNAFRQVNENTGRVKMEAIDYRNNFCKIGDEYVEMLEEAFSAEQAQEMIEGMDVDYDNTIAFPNFTTDNLKDDLEFDRNYPLILSCDFNYNPMCWYLMQEKEGTWYILKELIENNVTTKDMCKIIQPVIDSYGVRSLTIMGDSHGRDKKTNGSDYSVMLAHFSDAGYDCTLRVQKANPLIKDRLAVLRGLIKNAKGNIKLFVDSSCKWLIYNFEECKNQLSNGGLKIPTDKEIQNDDNKRYIPHPIDAISYPMHFLNSLRAIAGEQEHL